MSVKNILNYFILICFTFWNINSLKGQTTFTLYLLNPGVGPTSATISAVGFGTVVSPSFLSVQYGERRDFLNLVKLSNISFGGCCSTINGGTFNTSLQNLKQRTKYYYRYVINETTPGFFSRYTQIDSFVTTKFPYQVSLSSVDIHDTISDLKFVAKFVTDDPGPTKYNLNSTLLDNQYFTIRNDSLFSATTLKGIKKSSLTIRVNAIFSDDPPESRDLTVNLIDKTPPVIHLKKDTISAYLGIRPSISVLPSDFDSLTADFKSKVTVEVSKTTFGCENLGINKIKFFAKDESLNESIKDVYVLVYDTIKPLVYINKAKSLFLDSSGFAQLSISDIEASIPMPDSLFSRNLRGYYVMDSGRMNNLFDSSYRVVSSSVGFTFDRCLNKNTAVRFNGVDQSLDIGKNAAFVNATTSQTISFWAKLPFAPKQLPGFGDYQDLEGHRYFKSIAPLSWKKAKAVADSLGGYLAIPNNAAENTFLINLSAQWKLVSSNVYSMRQGWSAVLGATDPAKQYKMIVKGIWGIANSISHRDAAYQSTNGALITSNVTRSQNRGCDANWSYNGKCPPPIPDFPLTYSEVNTYEYFLGSGVSGGHTISFTDGGYNDNTGSLTFELYESVAAPIWLGINDEINEGKFYSVKGDTLKYSKWLAGQPNNLNNQDYIYMDASGQWGDTLNEANINYVIEFDINTGAFLGKYQNSDAANSYFYISPQSVSGNGTNSLSLSNVSIDSNWNHYVYVLDNGTNKTRVYLNNTLIAKGTLNYNTKLSTSDQTTVTIGRISGSPANYFTGSMDDLRIYNGAMSEDSIYALFNYERLCKPDRVFKTSDNCSIKEKILSQEKFGCADIGSKFISYSVIDMAGNRVDSTINLTVRDTIKPIIRVIDTIFRIDSINPLKINFTDFDNGSSDNCAINSRSLSKSEYLLKDTGTIILQYSLSDKSSNTSTKELRFKLLCKDPMPPIDQTLSICQGEQTTLKANVPQGSNGSLIWYSSSSGGVGSQVAPSPIPLNTSSLEYYVSHRYAGCESSKRGKITVNIKPQPIKPTLQRDSSGFLVSSSSIGNIWLKDGAILTDSMQRIKPQASGNFQVKNIVNGCANISSTYYYLVTSLLNNSNNHYFRVSPSPFKDAFILTFQNLNRNEMGVVIYNIADGRLVFSSKAVKSGISIDLLRYPSGAYLVKLSSSDGKIVLQKQIIKL